MDSKGVDALLRETLWPTLKVQGFTRRTGRTAWRDSGEAVQAVNVQSFNKYLADGLGATTFSFGVNLGVFFNAIADRSRSAAFIKDRTRPAEFQCHIRMHLTKGFAQPNEPLRPRFGIGRARAPLGAWRDRADVWLILPDGSNVQPAVQDVVGRLLAYGLPWLEAVSSPQEAIRRFHERENVAVPPGVVVEDYGGSLGSPNRMRSIAGLAAGCGDWELLKWSIEQMTGQAYWADEPAELDRLREELVAARATGAG